MDVLEKNEVLQFKDNEFVLDVNVSPQEETVWLNRQQIAELFDRDIKTIGKHIVNVFREGELDRNNSVANFAPQSSIIDYRTAKEQILKDRTIEYYDLDVIISVGYRVKSKRGILFRQWANRVLKTYLLKGYVLNNKHFQDIDYVTRILDDYHKVGGRLPSSHSLLEFLKAYQRGFQILDDYDHHTLVSPKGEKDLYIIDYDECINLIHETMFTDKGDQFAIEKDESFRSSIATIYQSFGGEDLYPTLEDKASALLYFIVKNHSFIDGNKRIGATIFLYFLSKNRALYKMGQERINNDTLATLTILVASSRPEDKDIVIELVETILN